LHFISLMSCLIARVFVSVVSTYYKLNFYRSLNHSSIYYRYVAVGNEPFLKSYNGQFQNLVMPAVLNLQQSLAKAKLASSIKLVVPCNADV
jgi:hypothetical protein